MESHIYSSTSKKYYAYAPAEEFIAPSLPFQGDQAVDAHAVRSSARLHT